MVGRVLLTGGATVAAVTVAVGALVDDAEPPLLVAVTVEVIAEPTSAETRR